MKELVSVIIPTYNRKNTLKRSIDSVLNQTYKNTELILVDDCSTDGTYEYVSELYGAMSNLIYVQNDENQGASGARNTGVLYANGDFIAFHDSDDEWQPTKLEKQMEVFKQNDDSLGMVYCQMKRFWRDGEIDFWPPSDMEDGKKTVNIFETALLTPLVGTPTMVIKKEMFLSLGGFDTNLKALEDYEFSLRFSKHYGVGYVNEPLIYVYDSPVSVGKQCEAMTETQVTIMQRYYEDYIKYNLRQDKMLYTWLQSEMNGCLETLENSLPMFAADEVYLKTFLLLEEKRRNTLQEKAKRKIVILLDDRDITFLDGITRRAKIEGVNNNVEELVRLLWEIEGTSKDTFVSLYHYNSKNFFPWTVKSIMLEENSKVSDILNGEKCDFVIEAIDKADEWIEQSQNVKHKIFYWLMRNDESYSENTISRVREHNRMDNVPDSVIKELNR